MLYSNVIIMLYFFYCSTKTLVTRRKKPNDPYGFVTPRLKTIGLANQDCLPGNFDTKEQS